MRPKIISAWTQCIKDKKNANYQFLCVCVGERGGGGVGSPLRLLPIPSAPVCSPVPVGRSGMRMNYYSVGSGCRLCVCA